MASNVSESIEVDTAGCWKWTQKIGFDSFGLRRIHLQFGSFSSMSACSSLSSNSWPIVFKMVDILIVSMKPVLAVSNIWNAFRIIATFWSSSSAYDEWNGNLIRRQLRNPEWFNRWQETNAKDSLIENIRKIKSRNLLDSLDRVHACVCLVCVIESRCGANEQRRENICSHYITLAKEEIKKKSWNRIDDVDGDDDDWKLRWNVN